MPRRLVAFCPSPLLLRKAGRRAVGITPRRPRHSVARASAIEKGDDSAAYDEFARMLGKADTANSDVVRRGVEDDSAPAPKREVDPAMYDAFDTLLERSGGAGRKVKNQQRYAGREGERRPPAPTGVTDVDSGRDLPGEKTEVRRTRSMTKAEIEEGYSFMDQAFAPKKKRPAAEGKLSSGSSGEQTGPPPTLSGPPPKLSAPPPKLKGSPSLSFPSASTVDEPKLVQKPRHGADEPVLWKEGASLASDPTRTKTADLGAPRRKTQSDSNSMLGKPTAPTSIGSTDFERETPVHENARPRASPADTTPLSPDEIEAGYTAMKSFFAADLAAAQEDDDDFSVAESPPLSGPPAAPPSTSIEVDATAPSPRKKPLRRVTSDPSTWREDWSAVPDPTRRKVASLDSPLPKSASHALPLTEKPTPPVPAAKEEATVSTISASNADNAAVVSTPLPSLSGGPAAPPADVLAAAMAKKALGETQQRARSAAPLLKLKNPKIVMLLDAAPVQNDDQDSGAEEL